MQILVLHKPTNTLFTLQTMDVQLVIMQQTYLLLSPMMKLVEHLPSRLVNGILVVLGAITFN